MLWWSASLLWWQIASGSTKYKLHDPNPDDLKNTFLKYNIMKVWVEKRKLTLLCHNLFQESREDCTIKWWTRIFQFFTHLEWNFWIVTNEARVTLQVVSIKLNKPWQHPNQEKRGLKKAIAVISGSIYGPLLLCRLFLLCLSWHEFGFFRERDNEPFKTPDFFGMYYKKWILVLNPWKKKLGLLTFTVSYKYIQTLFILEDH